MWNWTCISSRIYLRIISNTTVVQCKGTVLQARKATLDVEVDNIKGLIQDLKYLRDTHVAGNTILAESKLVAGLNVRMSL